MAELPILPLKTDAILADTTHMSTEEFGAYMKILIVMWRQGARLPDDERELALIACLPLPRWRKIAEKVRRPLTSAGGTLSQKNLTSTWLDVKELRRKRASAANTRWKGRGDANAYAKHDAKPMQTPMQNDPIQNQISKTYRTEIGAIGQTIPARSFATALPAGALAHEPDTEPADRPQEAWRGKPVCELNRTELAAYFASKENKH